MKRSGFKRPDARPAKQMDEYVPRPRPLLLATVLPVVPHISKPKQAALRSKAYRLLVAALPCAHCGVIGYSQAAHADQGKGMGLKSSDDTCYPACGPHFRDGLWLAGCHWEIGTSGAYTRQARRDLEARYAAQTRAKLGMI